MMPYLTEDHFQVMRQAPVVLAKANKKLKFDDAPKKIPDNCSLCNNPPNHMFWDGAHPGKQLHLMIKEVLIELLKQL